MRRKCGFILLATVFIWTVPWIAGSETQLAIPPAESLSNEELHRLMSMFSPKARKPKLTFYPKTTQNASGVKAHPLLRMIKRKSTQPIKRAHEPKELLQQLNFLNSLIDSGESERKTNEKVQAIIDQLDAANKHNNPTVQQPEDTASQALAALTSLLTKDTSSGSVQNPKENVAPPALRPTSDKEAAKFLSNLLLVNTPAKNGGNPQFQDFQSFSNSDVGMDAEASNQLSSLITLLGTLGSLGGGNQMSNLLNLAAQPQQNPGILGLLGANQQQGNALASIFAPQNQNQQLFSSLLNPQGSATTLQQSAQAPGFVPSLIGLGSSVSSLVGNTFQRLSGTRVDGKPRVRGFDTRLGLGYRLGQAMDAQMMWEVGPQIFTVPLENEKRDHGPAPAAQQISPELQRQLEELLSNNQLQKRRQAAAQKAKEDEENDQLEKLFHAEASEYTPRAVAPHPMRIPPAPTRYHLPFRPFPSYSKRIPQTVKPLRRPNLANIPGPAPVVQLPPRSAKPTVPAAGTMNTAAANPQENNMQPYEMLTSYEKWLLRRSQGFTNRMLELDKENAHWPMPQEVLPTPCPIGQKSSDDNQSKAPNLVRIAHTQRRRLTRKSEEPANPDTMSRRMGQFEPLLPRPALPMRPYLPHYYSMPLPVAPLPYPRRRVAFAPPRRVYPSYYYPPPQMRAHFPPAAPQYAFPPVRNAPPQYAFPPIQNAPPQYAFPPIQHAPPTQNPYQNFIPEADDSFNRRNKIASQAGGAKTVDEQFGTAAVVQDSKPSQSISVHVTEEAKPGEVVGNLLKKAVDNPVMRLLFPTTTTPPIGAEYVGEYHPTEEPVLIATPTATPLPTLFDHFGRPRTTPHPPHMRDHPNPYIHIGEQLSYDQLASTLSLSTRPRVRTYKNGTKVTRPEGDEEEEEGPSERPINHPGMEMFIDVESGEVSVRKPIASLAHFGDMTTTPRPMTDDEREDEESLKIYERLQNHFKASMEEYHMQQEVNTAMKEHKDKIKKEQDDSLGMVNSSSSGNRERSTPSRSSGSRSTVSSADTTSDNAARPSSSVYLSAIASDGGLEAPADQPSSSRSISKTSSTSSEPISTSTSTSIRTRGGAKKAKLEEDDSEGPSTSTASSTTSSVKGLRRSERRKVANHQTLLTVVEPTPSTSTTPPSPPVVDLDAVSMDSSEEYEDSGNESSGEDVEFAMERDDRGPTERSTEEEFPFTVLSTEAIVQHMVDSIKEANTVLQLPTTTMRILLNHFGWDKEKLLEAYYDGDPSKVFKAARVIDPRIPRPQISSQVSGAEDCHICYLQKPSSMMYGLECGHRFCTLCWSEYLTTKIMEEGMGQTIACAAHDCPILVDDATVMKLVGDPKVKLKYQHLITNSFVQCNRLMRWCPSADCTNAVRVQWVDWRPVTCACNFVFCFQCGQAWHDPVKCSWLKRWLKKCDDDSETSNWIAANTKECPRCNATIEKDGGCNHMVCKNQNCKADFCWVCLGPWEPHGSSWYNCNRFDETEAKAARDAQEKSRAALQRYLFYCNRYMNHMQSLKFEHKLYASVKDKMEEMQQHNMSWIEVQFLKKAVDILCQCRQTLMYTYVFAFYLVKNNQSVIFEDNQRDLESATEKLSEYLEREITSENLADIKQKVQDKYRYCESRRQVLLDHVYEGYEKDWWVYNETVHSQ